MELRERASYASIWMHAASKAVALFAHGMMQDIHGHPKIENRAGKELSCNTTSASIHEGILARPGLISYIEQIIKGLMAWTDSTWAELTILTAAAD